MRRKEGFAALIAAALIVLGILAVFAIELSDNQAKSRSDIKARVHERSVLAAALIDSLFQTSAGTASRVEAREFGGPSVSQKLLNRTAGRNAYAVLLAADGSIVAQSSSFNAQARSDLKISETLKLLRAGHPWALGNVLPYGRTGIINYGIALATPYGKRYLLTGFKPETLRPFLLGELRQIPGVKGAWNSVVDGAGVFIASTSPVRPTGYRLSTPAQLRALNSRSGYIMGRYFDHEPLANTSWRIFLSAPQGRLFASVSGLRKWIPWIIFIAFGIVALVALLLVRRVIGDQQRVSASNRMLSDSNGQLADAKAALERSNEELERQAHELVRSNAELDQFASIASHDLQEPLRKVRTFTERISQTEAANLTERGQDYLRRANSSAERMQTLIEDLLRYSRVSTQDRPFTTVNLSIVAAEVLEDLSEQIQRTGAIVRIGDLPTIQADAPQMRQLLQNLVSNAVKFRREGVTPEVEVEASSDAGWVTLAVRDNGIGFDPQYSQRIFRVFERLHGRGTYPGTGIGLALCRKIAERHGGMIVASSVPDEGSTFTVTMQTQRTEAVTDVPRGDDNAARAPEDPYVAA